MVPGMKVNEKRLDYIYKNKIDNLLAGFGFTISTSRVTAPDARFATEFRLGSLV